MASVLLGFFQKNQSKSRLLIDLLQKFLRLTKPISLNFKQFTLIKDMFDLCSFSGFAPFLRALQKTCALRHSQLGALIRSVSLDRVPHLVEALLPSLCFRRDAHCRGVQFERLFLSADTVHRVTRNMILRNVGNLFFFHPQNPTGRYALKVSSSPCDRAVLETLFLINEWEKSIAKYCNQHDIAMDLGGTMGANTTGTTQATSTTGAGTGPSAQLGIMMPASFDWSALSVEDKSIVLGGALSSEQASAEHLIIHTDLSESQDWSHFRNCCRKIVHVEAGGVKKKRQSGGGSGGSPDGKGGNQQQSSSPAKRRASVFGVAADSDDEVDGKKGNGASAPAASIVEKSYDYHRNETLSMVSSGSGVGSGGGSSGSGHHHEEEVFFFDYASSLCVHPRTEKTSTALIEKLCAQIEASDTPIYSKVRALRSVTHLLCPTLKDFIRLLKTFPEGTGWLDEADLRSMTLAERSCAGVEAPEPRAEFFLLLWARCPHREDVASHRLLYNKNVISEAAQAMISRRLGRLATFDVRRACLNTVPRGVFHKGAYDLNLRKPEDRVLLYVLGALVIAEEEAEILQEGVARESEGGNGLKVTNAPLEPQKTSFAEVVAAAALKNSAVSPASIFASSASGPPGASKMSGASRENALAAAALLDPLVDIPTLVGKAAFRNGPSTIPAKGMAKIAILSKNVRDEVRHFLRARWCDPTFV
ncbi:unnamed protein product [Amoebophrya sp. A25]|nr:unnamed protein product [Amoebophrya sp. A25]|eukprot:GSA25T00007298001.1